MFDVPVKITKDVMPTKVGIQVINGLVPHHSLPSNVFIGGGDDAWIPDHVRNDIIGIL